MDNLKPFVLVTGASSGIGKQISIRLSEAYNIILSGRDEQRLKEVHQACNAQSKCLIWQSDFNDLSDLEGKLSEFIKENNIVIDHFVHCAGYMKMLPVKMTTVEQFYQTFNTNVFAAHFITKVLTNKKVNNSALKSGVFISSNISNMGAKALSVYGSSKGALDSLMRCLAIELAPKVRLNSVLPGAVLTEMTDAIFENEEVADRMQATYPLGFGQPEDIFQMVFFLLSDKSKWITGQQFTVDGGRTINISG